MGVGHAFLKAASRSDLLAPEHLGARSRPARTTLEGAHTVEVPHERSPADSEG